MATDVTRVLVGGKLHPSGLAVLRAMEGWEVDYIEEVSTTALVPSVFEADALLLRTQPLPGELIDRSRRLRIVSRHGVGYDAVDMAALNRHGIPLTIVGDVNSRTVAEHAMLLILAATRRLNRYQAAAGGSSWDYRNSLEAEELPGKELLIIGFGRIGRQLARLAEAFGLRVSVYDPYQQPTAEHHPEVTAVDHLQDALAHADIVSVHVPPAGQPVLGRDQFAAMKRGVILINTARGEVVDENALIEALDNGTVGGAGLDVFEQEPPPPGHRLATYDQVVLTPHSAGMTLQCAERMAVAAAQNIVDYFNGKLDTSLIVNRESIRIEADR